MPRRVAHHSHACAIGRQPAAQHRRRIEREQPTLQYGHAVRKPVRFVDPGPWMRYVHPVLKHLFFGAPRRIVRRGEFYVPYFTANPRFDNSGLQALLTGSGLEVPSVASYLRRLLQYCLDTDWGRRPLPT